MWRFDKDTLISDMLESDMSSKDLGVDQIIPSQILSGVRVLSIPEFLSICQALGTDPNKYIVSEDE